MSGDGDTSFSSRPGNAQALHFVEQCRASQSQYGGGAVRPADHPISSFESLQNVIMLSLLEGHRYGRP